jgi:hypothetical protein
MFSESAGQGSWSGLTVLESLQRHLEHRPAYHRHGLVQDQNAARMSHLLVHAPPFGIDSGATVPHGPPRKSRVATDIPESLAAEGRPDR